MKFFSNVISFYSLSRKSRLESFKNCSHRSGCSLCLCISFVLIDLFFGVRRAKRLHIVRTSSNYRRTITKLTNYFGLMLMLSIADIVASVVFKMPYFTVTGAIGIVLVEAKSVFENLKDQEKSMEEVQKMLLKILENKEEIKTILSLLNTHKEENKL
ncbi:MAG TPA: phage holin family protein [Paludibacteraceae bacterium]|nr:phage holin family protein [Paludibacteraceae bacterium]